MLILNGGMEALICNEKNHPGSLSRPHLQVASTPNTETNTDWRIKLHQELPLLGHRSWIMIVDSDCPLQISPGVETIETGADLPHVARVVLDTLDHSIHVTPTSTSTPNSTVSPIKPRPQSASTARKIRTPSVEIIKKNVLSFNHTLLKRFLKL